MDYQQETSDRQIKRAAVPSRGDCDTQNMCAGRPQTDAERQDALLLRIAERLRYHSPRPDQLPKYQALRDAANFFAVAMIRNVPPGVDLEDALLCLERTLMTANKGIALG